MAPQMYDTFVPRIEYEDLAGSIGPNGVRVRTKRLESGRARLILIYGNVSESSVGSAKAM